MTKNKNTFDNFVTYEGNQLAHAVLYEVSSNPVKPLSPLYLFGGTGLGKTHLVNAAAEQYEEGGKVSYIVVTTAERFRNEYIHALRMQILTDFYAKYECADVLIMENFNQLSSYREMQQVFREIFDILQENGKQIILTGDVPPGHLVDLEKSLLSKVMSGYSVEIEAPHYDERLMILEAEMDTLLANLNMQADPDELDEIFCYIANSEVNDIRKMKGMLNRVVSFAALLEEKITMSFAERVLGVK